MIFKMVLSPAEVLYLRRLLASGRWHWEHDEDVMRLFREVIKELGDKS